MKAIRNLWRAFFPRSNKAITDELRELIEEIEYNADLDLRHAEAIESSLEFLRLRLELRPFTPLTQDERNRAHEMKSDATEFKLRAEFAASLANDLREVIA